ncbi:MAG: tetraacyldisaccharide 4'-kinase [Thermoanaerobaculia bacterium]
MHVLAPIERAYRAVNRVRRALYRRGILRQERAARPVISIGNRAIGGSGKTPAVIAVAEGLLERGIRPVVLTRGYGRRSAAEPLRVESNDAARFGDEPVLIARRLPAVPVVVGSRRAEAARWFLAHGDCDVFLLDDGFQHLQLAREVDVVVETPRARWYREGPAALASADVLLVRDGRGDPQAVPPRFAAALRATSWIESGVERPLGELRGQAAVAFAGLADNEQFFASLRDLGVEVRETLGFPDHHAYAAGDLERVAQARARTSACIALTTEKDLVKIPHEGFSAVRVTMEIEPRAALFDLLAASVRREFRIPADGLWRP